jgi:hypothetical protein
LSKERHGRLIQAVAGSGWSCVYQDALAVVFARPQDID